jgi:tRNA1Val (adenine37-N6)-methyltransferase
MTALEVTCDVLFGGALTFTQHREGYRFGIDALLLASSVTLDPPSRLADVGSGVGVVGLAAAHLLPELEVVCVEVQAGLASLAHRNIAANGLQARVRVVAGDIREIGGDDLASVDLALMNPPYYPKASGHLNPSSERAAAKHEVFGTLGELLGAIACRLDRKGKIRLIYPAEALPRLLDVVRKTGMKATRLEPIHSFADAMATFVLLDIQQSGRREMQIAPGMVIFDRAGEYTPDVQRIIEGHHRR